MWIILLVTSLPWLLLQIRQRWRPWLHLRNRRLPFRTARKPVDVLHDAFQLSSTSSALRSVNEFNISEARYWRTPAGVGCSPGVAYRIGFSKHLIASGVEGLSNFGYCQYIVGYKLRHRHR